MSLQIVNVLERDGREHLYDLSVDSGEYVPVGAELGLLAVPYGELAHYLKVVDQHHHETQLVREADDCEKPYNVPENFKKYKRSVSF